MAEQRYHILRRIGQGGMGTVFLAQDRLRQELVALKRMQSASPGARLRFKSEFRGVTDLAHPNLVRLLELGEDEEGLFFTMELVDGVDLDRFCRHGADVVPRPTSDRSVTWTDPASAGALAPRPADVPAPLDSAPTVAVTPLGASWEPEDVEGSEEGALGSAPTEVLERRPVWPDRAGRNAGGSDARSDEGEYRAIFDGGTTPQTACRRPNRRREVKPVGVPAPDQGPPSDAPPSVERPGATLGTPDGPPGELAAPTIARPRPTRDQQALLARLSHALPQILDALSFLHAAGVVHRDLKPANVLVTRSRQVKLLDFGVLGVAGPSSAEPGATRPAAGGDPPMGTLGYMAPEQLRGQPARPAMDLYSLGAMLYEILAGRPVFEQAGVALLSAHLVDPPPPLAPLAPWAPPELTHAVMALLAKDPSARPTPEALRRTLLPTLLVGEPSRRTRHRRGRLDLIGREALEAQLAERLEARWDGRFTCLALEGPAGAGKSSLAKTLSQRLARAGWQVFRGRGRANERVAFNLMDGVVDDLSARLRTLARRGALSEIGRSLQIAATAFPVLETSQQEEPLGAVTRPAAFQAIADLFAMVAREATGLLLYLDDAHWADQDSLALLDHLSTMAPPKVVILTTLRDDVGPNPAATWLASRTAAQRVQVPPLDGPATCSLVTRVAGLAPDRLTREQRDRIETECQGNPMLAEVLGRRLARTGVQVLTAPRALTLRDSVGALLAEADETTWRTLATLLAADEWVQVGDLAAILELRYGALEDTLSRLGHAALVRTRGGRGPEGRMDVYHDALRAPLQAAVPAARLLEAHGAWADHLLRRPGARPERLVRHLLAAGRRSEARPWARRAAEAAERQHAFSLAADLYALALEGDGEDTSFPDALSTAHARCLQQAGRFGEAAKAWRRIELRLRGDPGARAARGDALLGEVVALLSANEFRAGRARLTEALQLAGDPPLEGARLSAWLSGARFLLGPLADSLPSRPRVSETMDPAAAQRAVRTASLVGHFDILGGIRLLQRAQKRMLGAGLFEAAANCDYLLAFMALFQEPQAGRTHLAERYAEAARRRLGHRRPSDPLLRIMPRFIQGAMAQHRGAWPEAAAAYEEVMDRIAQLGLVGTYEYSRVLYHRCVIALGQQDLPTLARLVTHWETVGQGSHRLATHGNYASIRAYLQVFQGRPRAALAEIEQAQRVYPPDMEHLQSRALRFLTWLPRIYLESCWRSGQDRDLVDVVMRFGPMHRDTHTGVASLVEANALRTGAPGARLRRVRRLRDLGRGCVPLRPAAATRALAYAYDATGRPDRARALLQEARDAATRLGQQIDQAIAEHQLGMRQGGRPGADLRRTARERIAAAGSGPVLLEEDAGLRSEPLPDREVDGS